MNLLRLIIDKFQGMSSLIAPEKLPPYVMKLLVNLEPAKLLGNLKKRTGYAQLLSSGLTTLKSMYEFVDKNDNRQILLQDGTGLEESVYSGGSYGATAAIANDERTAGSTVDQAYPVEFNRELRSPAGVNAATDRPFWYGYIAERDRFNGDATISAGKYLDEQFRLAVSYLTLPLLKEGYLTADPLDETKDYVIYIAPEYDGYQRGLPYSSIISGVRIPYGYKSVDYYTGTPTSFYLSVGIQVTDAQEDLYPRITAYNFFVAVVPKELPVEDAINYPAYFLHRIDLEEDSKPILEVKGTLEAANPPTYVEFDRDFDEWESFNLGGFYASFTASTDYEKKLGARTENGTKVQYAISGLVNADNGLDVTCRIFSRWENVPGFHDFVFIYDNHHVKLGSEMYEYLGIPTGDAGLSDYRHKFSAEAGNRYLICGCAEDERSAFFSVPYNFDVIPAQNRIRLKKDPTGCIGINNDFYIFYKDGAKRFSILANGEYSADDEFLDIGLVGQKAITKINEDLIFFMSYKGPCILVNRTDHFVGEDLITWWEDTLTDAQKEACVVTYNNRKEQVWFSFPTYTTSPYTSGIVFVYDLKAHRKNMNAWWILKTGVAIKNACLSDDLHLLTGNDTAVYDWNNDTPTEEVDTKLQILLMKSPNAGRSKKTFWKSIYVDVDTDDTVSANAYFNGSGTPTTLTFSGDMTAALRYVAETLQIEIETSASTNDAEISMVELRFRPLGV